MTKVTRRNALSSHALSRHTPSSTTSPSPRSPPYRADRQTTGRHKFPSPSLEFTPDKLLSTRRQLQHGVFTTPPGAPVGGGTLVAGRSREHGARGTRSKGEGARAAAAGGMYDYRNKNVTIFYREDGLEGREMKPSSSSSFPGKSYKPGGGIRRPRGGNSRGDVLPQADQLVGSRGTRATTPPPTPPAPPPTPEAGAFKPIIFQPLKTKG
ncbi:hypothetical protein E2C01_041787 [Portunus trituberculatus]|uniref:Uncharacterized protein n=1 Tax=Portunus trituberculatus TaxID=210409 RepID=A0A5B7FNG1_PORTR|nr:hypothetical protein [Portunus trituberculatus]